MRVGKGERVWRVGHKGWCMAREVCESMARWLSPNATTERTPDIVNSPNAVSAT